MFIVNLAGNTRKVIEGLANPVWFPGDMRLAGSVPKTDGIRFARLATVDVSGESLRIFESVPARRIRLSPNGRYAATEFFWGFAFGVFSTVYIHDFVTGDLVTLLGLEFEVEPEIVRDISFLGGWAPDSSQLVYSTFLNENDLGEIRIADLAGNIRQRFGREYYPFADWGPVVTGISARSPTYHASATQYVSRTRPTRRFLARFSRISLVAAMHRCLPPVRADRMSRASQG